MLDKSKFERDLDRCDNYVMRGLVRLARDATGSYHPKADESLTIHIGGTSGKYRTRHTSQKIDSDPVLSRIQTNPSLRTKRLSVGTSTKRNSHVIVTFEYIGD